MGDRVALPWLGHACPRCRYCIAGWETYCVTPPYMGYTMDGGYAEFTIAYASHVVKVPEAVSSLDAALNRTDASCWSEEVLAGRVPARLVFDLS